MITIVPSKADWSTEFKQIAVELHQRLGQLVLRIDHIGSTAVVGLAAKDVIDVQLSVASLDEKVITAMQALGYRQPAGVWRDHCPPGSPEAENEWSKFLLVEPEGQRRINVHVRVQGRANQRYALLFRDYLRAHPAMAAAYGQLKQRLSENLADTQAYPDVKDPAVDLIYLAAEDWAAATGWQLGPSDGYVGRRLPKNPENP